MQTSTTSRKRLSAENSLALWREYKATHDIQVRNRLVMTYAPLVKYIVFKKVRELPVRCDVEDFIACGLEALIASIDRYDPAKGATLEQFAWTRIHGAVLDELRRQDWAPRSLRRWERDIERAGAVHRHPRPSADPSGARRLPFDHRRGASPSRGRHRRLRRHLAQHARDLRRRDHGRAPQHARRTEVAATRRPPRCSAAKDKFRRAFDTLPRRDREVAVLLYVKNLTLREIGEIVGVSESRVCQIHSQLKRTLKAQLSEDAQLFTAVG